MAIAGWAAVNFVLAYQHLLLPKGPPHWDEASHGLQGLIIASDLRTGDLLAFLYDSYRQVYWPPVFSWMAGALFLPLGATTETARLSSLIWMVPLPVVLFLAGQRLHPARPCLAGLLAAGLALTSVSMADMGSYAMLEMPGLLAISLGLWLHLRFTDRPTTLGAVLLGLALMLTYLTKSNYGVLLVLAVLLERFLGARLNPRKAFWEAPARYAFLTLGAALLLWFAYPPKLRNSWTALVNSPYGPVDAYTLEGLLYYPRALVSLVGPAWLLALVLATVAASLVRLSNPKLRFLLVFVFLQMGLATWSATKLERHIFPMLPPLFLLAAYWVTWLADRLWGQGAWPARPLAALVPTLLLAGSSQAFYADILGRPSGPQGQEAFRPLQHLAELSREAGPLLLASTKDLALAPPQVDWYLATEGGMPVWAAGTLKGALTLSPRLAKAFPPLFETLARLQDRGEALAATRTLYSEFPLYAPELLTEPEYAARILETAGRYRLRTVVIAQTQEGASYHQQGLVERGLLAAGYRLVGSRDFPEPVTKVRVYRRD